MTQWLRMRLQNHDAVFHEACSHKLLLAIPLHGILSKVMCLCPWNLTSERTTQAPENSTCSSEPRSDEHMRSGFDEYSSISSACNVK
jgi:hypothetical protein